MTFKSSIFNGWEKAFWNPSFWLPRNMTWEDFNDTPDVTYPKYYEVFYPIVFSVVILFLRYLVERFIFIPIGISQGLKAKKKPMISIPLIEEVLLKKNSKDIFRDQNQIIGLAKQLDWSERQVERWIRRREKHRRHSELEKFAECGWKVCYFSFATAFGIAYLFNKPWVWKISECWTNYPHQSVSLEIKIIYLLQTSFYWSMILSHFYEVRRKDFWGMFIHHISTVSMLNISYISNYICIGMMVLVIHDWVHPFLGATKCFNYIKWRRSANLSFVLFVLVWIVSRLVIFPGYILNHLFFESGDFIQIPPSLYLGMLLLVILFLLNILWTYYIAKVLYGMIFLGKKTNDSRSSSSEISDHFDESTIQNNSNNDNSK